MTSSAQRSRIARRGVAPAKPEGERGGDRRRAEDQPERQHHDLVGQAHEGEADRGEQGDDRIADDGLRIAAFAGPAADQLGDDPREEDPTTMISVPKMTLPPSSVTWARKIAMVSPPSCFAASIEAARMIAIMAMLATIRDGLALGGSTPVERIAWSKPVGGRIASMIVLRKRPTTKAMPIHNAAASMRGMRSKDLVEHRDRRTGDRLDAQHLQRGDRDRDDDQREDEHAGRLGEAGARRARRGPGGTAAGSVRTVPAVSPMPIRGEQAVDVGRDRAPSRPAA